MLDLLLRSQGLQGRSDLDHASLRRASHAHDLADAYLRCSLLLTREKIPELVDVQPAEVETFELIDGLAHSIIRRLWKS
eukprot:scaffold7068_cov301-Pinguiococcus_pyrenoidosus.AAC.10